MNEDQTDDAVLRAVQKFMDAVETRLNKHSEEIRAAVTDFQTRAIPEPIEGAQGVDGKDGVDGTPGAPGERGADGIATREELDALVEQRFGELQVRTFADIYRGVYSPSETYTRGQLATWGGSVYLAKADTTSKPGESVDWQMIVKRGADARR